MPNAIARQIRAQDFLALTDQELRAKYPDNEEIQRCLEHIDRARMLIKAPEDEREQTINDLRRRLALNLAQGLPPVFPPELLAPSRQPVAD